MVVANFASVIGAQGSFRAWNVNLRGMGGRIKALCLLVLVVWIMRSAVQLRPSLSPMFGMRVRAFDDAAHDIWVDYILQHPIEADDRYGFKEMGFRTHAYAEFARTHQIGKLERIEERLFSFAPGASQIRQQALHVNPLNTEKPQGSKLISTPSVETMVKAQIKKSGRLSANQTSAFLKAAQIEEEARGGKRRGIIMVVNRETTLAALQTITVLRELHGCLLPVEIFYHTDAELPPALVDMFTALGRVSTIDIDTLPLFTAELEDDAGRYPGLKETWERQSLALLASSFQEVLVVDPQVVFLQNPALLFSHPTFANTGTLFFRSKATPVSKASQFLVAFLKRQLDQGPGSQQLADSAFMSHKIGSRMDMDVVVLDKSRPGVLAALFMNAWMRRGFVRAVFWGAYPKMMNEGLWLAFELADIAYDFENTWPGAIGRFDGDWDDHSPLICSPRTIQFLSPQVAQTKLSRKYFSFFHSTSSSRKKTTKVQSGNSKLHENAAGEIPFWFHGGYLVPGQAKETYYTPNVYARNVPPVEEDQTDPDNCLYGATLNKLKGTVVPSILQNAVEVAHEAFKTHLPEFAYYAAAPQLQVDKPTDKKDKKGKQ